MSFQKTIYRQYTQGFIGEIHSDGPVRAKSGIIAAAVTAINPNRIGRAFGYSSDLPVMGNSGATPAGTGTVTPATEGVVQVGAAKFYGILGIPKHYASFGTTSPIDGSQPGPLAPTYDLLVGTEGEFLDMAIMTLAVSNGNDSTKDMTYGMQVYYCIAAAAATAGYAQTSTTDVGRLYVFPDTTKQSPPVGQFAPIPNSRTTTVVVGVPMATPNATDGTAVLDAGSVAVRVQLTQ